MAVLQRKFYVLIGSAIATALLLAANSILAPVAQAQSPIGTAFVFQGYLSNAAGAVSGNCDFRFRLYDSESAGQQIGSDLFRTAVQVAEGRFTTELDFGATFTGAGRWLEISVRCPAGGGNYAVLTPRQRVSPAPYAMLAERVANLDRIASNLVVSGTILSTRATPDAVGGAGAIQLENPASGNRWHIATIAASDTLVLGLLDPLGNWSEGAAITTNNGGHLTAGVVRAARAAISGDERTGLLQILNTVSNNMWEIFSRFGTDNLEIWFGDNSSVWSKALTVERDGDLVVEGELFVAGGSLLINRSSAGIMWGNSDAAVGLAGSAGDYSAGAQSGDLVIRAANGKRLVLGRGASAQNFPAALSVEASGLVSIPNLQTGGVVEANLQTPDELAAERIDHFTQGDVLCWNSTARRLQRCTEFASPLVVAVANADGKPLIAGVEPVRVCGEIHPGDLLVASNQPGCAVAWAQNEAGNPPPGVVIAKALDASSQGERIVLAMILAR